MIAEMKHILTIREQDIVPDSPVIDVSAFKKREAARAILFDDNGEVYLISVTKHGYHKLPGGGINEDEGKKQALKRELMEEIGCQAEIVAELGAVVEYRDFDGGGLAQTSYCYLAKQVGRQVASALEEDEIAEGMIGVKAKSVDVAFSLLSHDKPNNLEGYFILKRDLAFLRAAKEQLLQA